MPYPRRRRSLSPSTLVCALSAALLALTFVHCGQTRKDRQTQTDSKPSWFWQSPTEKLRTHTQVLAGCDSPEAFCIRRLKMPFSNVYLVSEKREGLLVDAGMPLAAPFIKAMIHAAGVDLHYVHITHSHFDHYGSAQALTRLIPTRIGIHLADAQDVAQGITNVGQVASAPFDPAALNILIRSLVKVVPGVRPDLIFREKSERVPLLNTLQAEAMALPGHTPGSSALVITHDGKRYAFVGDLLSSQGSLRANRSFAANWDELRKSVITLMQTICPNQIFPGHGSRAISLSDVEDILFSESYADRSRLELEQAISCAVDKLTEREKPNESPF